MSVSGHIRHHLVIPAYNEARRLPKFLQELAEAISVSKLKADVLVVDDGSASGEREAMAQAVRAVRERHPFVLPLLALPQNRGKGGAVRAGWHAAPAEADWVSFVDADGAICPAEVVRILSMMDEGMKVDAWFASRICMLGRKISRSRSRHVTGRVFASMVGAWVDGEVYDSQCGFKGMRMAVWLAVRNGLEEDGFAFDVELLAALRAHGASLCELPINWTDQPGSKVSVLWDGWRMFCAVRRIRNRFALGRQSQIQKVPDMVA